MATETIIVRENSSPLITKILKDFRNAVDPEKARDITGFEIRFIAKPTLDVSDAQAFFDEVATLSTPLEGEYQFQLSPKHYPNGEALQE